MLRLSAQAHTDRGQMQSRGQKQRHRAARLFRPDRQNSGKRSPGGNRKNNSVCSVALLLGETVKRCGAFCLALPCALCTATDGLEPARPTAAGRRPNQARLCPSVCMPRSAAPFLRNRQWPCNSPVRCPAKWHYARPVGAQSVFTHTLSLFRLPRRLLVVVWVYWHQLPFQTVSQSKVSGGKGAAVRHLNRLSG